MNAKAANTSLAISIDPQTVYISTGKNQNSYAKSITVSIHNNTNSAVQIAEITVTLPDILAPYDSLGSITPVANPSELWDFNPSEINEGEFDATSMSGNAVPLNPGDVWQFSLQDVTLVSQIIQSSANVVVFVTFADGTTQSQPLPVNILPATASVTFNAQPSTINPGESSVLSWDCTEIEYVIIDELGDKHRKPTDSADVRPNDTTTYTLFAYSNDVLLEEQKMVTVSNPQVITFGGAGGLTSVDYGSMLNLTWSCNQFTKSITITDDRGVSIPDLFTNGNSVEQGTISVGPVINPTTFVLTAFGDTKENFVQAEPTIFINDVYQTLNANPDSDIWELDAVVLSWKISSAASVELSPPVDNGPSLDNLVGSATIHPQDALCTYTLTVTGFKNNKFGEFSTEVPLTVQQVSINSFIQTPPQIILGQGDNDSCILNWVTNAQVVSINNGIGNVSPNSSYRLWRPDNGSEYVLTAGTIQNQNLLTQPLIIVNSNGPYTFNSIQPDPTYKGGLNLRVTNGALMAYLKPGDLYLVKLTGVSWEIIGESGLARLVALSSEENPYPSFTVAPWPLQSNGPPFLFLGWLNPNNPTGTIALQFIWIGPQAESDPA